MVVSRGADCGTMRACIVRHFTANVSMHPTIKRFKQSLWRPCKPGVVGARLQRGDRQSPSPPRARGCLPRLCSPTRSPRLYLPPPSESNIRPKESNPDWLGNDMFISVRNNRWRGLRSVPAGRMYCAVLCSALAAGSTMNCSHTSKIVHEFSTRLL